MQQRLKVEACCLCKDVGPLSLTFNNGAQAGTAAQACCR